MSKKLKLLLLVSGYPTERKPSNSRFNKVAAEQLSEAADLTLIQLSMWTPKKKIIDHLNKDSAFKHYRISVPFPKVSSGFLLRIHFYFYFLVIKKRLNQLVKEADIIHSVGAHVSGYVGSEIGNYFEKPHILQIIGSDVNSFTGGVGKKNLYSKMGNWLHGVGCNSTQLKNAFIKAFKEVKLMPVIYNGVDVDSIAFIPRPITNSKTFLYLGGLPQYGSASYSYNLKGGVTLMNVWRNNERLFNNSNSRLVFGGPNSINNYSKLWLESLEFKKNVEIIGEISHPEVLEMIKNSDVVIIPSFEEGMPNIAMESGAIGRCIIATNVGGLPEIIENERSGYLFEPGDEKALANLMLSCANNTVDTSSAGKNLRTTVQNRFNSRHFVENYLRLYDEAIKDFKS